MEKGMICESRKALEEKLSDAEKATIANARVRVKEVVGEEMYAMVAKSMCDGCCGKACKKDSASCKESDRCGASEDGEKKCSHKDGKKRCKHGHYHGMMDMMKDMDKAEVRKMHQALLPTIDALVAIAKTHNSHIEEVKAHHNKMMETCHHEHSEEMSAEMKAKHDKEHAPEQMEQMMIVHYLLMDCSKCERDCKKSEKDEE